MFWVLVLLGSSQHYMGEISLLLLQLNRRASELCSYQCQLFSCCVLCLLYTPFIIQLLNQRCSPLSSICPMFPLYPYPDINNLASLNSHCCRYDAKKWLRASAEELTSSRASRSFSMRRHCDFWPWTSRHMSTVVCGKGIWLAMNAQLSLYAYNINPLQDKKLCKIYKPTQK